MMEHKDTALNAPEAIGAVLVCGAGITGIQASLDLAESGFKVYLLDSSPAIGGRMAQLDKTFPTGDCAMCILSPKLVECARNKNIEIVTLADVQGISGEPGNFKVKIRQNPRYVDLDKCNACGDCTEACPVSLPSEFDRRLGTRKAIFRPYPQAIPNVFGISKAAGRAPCKASCPAGVNAQGYVALIGAGKFAEAYELIRERCPLPAACGRVCQHPCQDKCNRAEIDEAVNVRDLKRFAADYIHANPEEYPPAKPAAAKLDAKVAIVGGGPAGLTAASDLALLGYGVTLFEAQPQLGGMLRYGIPSYRLPNDVLDKEIQYILDLGVEARTSTPVADPEESAGRRVQCRVRRPWRVDQPHAGHSRRGRAGRLGGARFPAPGEQRRDAAHRAEGGGDRRRRRGHGCRALRPAYAGREVGGPGVSGEPRGNAGARLGGGRGARRRRRLPQQPGAGEDRCGGRSGVAFRACTSVFDENKRFNPQFDDSKTSALAADTVIVTIGQGIDSAGLGVATGPGGRIVAAKDTLATSVAGIFAGGDAVLGPASMVDAMAQGHRAAEAIDAYLRGAKLAPTNGARAIETANNPKPDAPKRERVKMPQAAPAARLRDFTEIDLGYSPEQAMAEAQRCLACGLCSECMQCVKACSAGAVCHDQQAAEHEIGVGSVILTPGFEEFQASLRGEFGHGRYANVLSSVQFERMLSAAGPTGGHVQRPSDGGEVKKIAFIQCVGSRDAARGNGYCSSICCMSATKEAMVALEHAHGQQLDVSIFCMDVRAFGKEFDSYVNRARDENGVKFIRAIPSRVVEMPGTKTPRVRYFDQAGVEQQQEFDLVVLSVGLRVPASVQGNGGAAGARSQPVRLRANRAAVSAGDIQARHLRGRGVPGTQGHSGIGGAGLGGGGLRHGPACLRARQLDPAPRISLGARHHRRIAARGRVHLPLRPQHRFGHRRGTGGRPAARMPNVFHAEASLYTCSDTNQQHIKDAIKKHRLNRLVVASCSPRTHEILFQETLRESGLNQYLFAMTNIRDQCSWVHKDDPVAATDKAVDLMSMAVARARHLKPLETGQLPVTASALIIGGGLAGMTAALGIADQGFEVHLVEKEAALGGNLRTCPHHARAGRRASLPWRPGGEG